jgi:hypothetical protein
VVFDVSISLVDRYAQTLDGNASILQVVDLLVADTTTILGLLPVMNHAELVRTPQNTTKPETGELQLTLVRLGYGTPHDVPTMQWTCSSDHVRVVSCNTIHPVAPGVSLPVHVTYLNHTATTHVTAYAPTSIRLKVDDNVLKKSSGVYQHTRLRRLVVFSNGLDVSEELDVTGSDYHFLVKSVDDSGVVSVDDAIVYAHNVGTSTIVAIWDPTIMVSIEVRNEAASAQESVAFITFRSDNASSPTIDWSNVLRPNVVSDTLTTVTQQHVFIPISIPWGMVHIMPSSDYTLEVSPAQATSYTINKLPDTNYFFRGYVTGTSHGNLTIVATYQGAAVPSPTLNPFEVAFEVVTASRRRRLLSSLASHSVVSSHIASSRIASHRIASHRIASLARRAVSSSCSGGDVNLDGSFDWEDIDYTMAFYVGNYTTYPLPEQLEAMHPGNDLQSLGAANVLYLVRVFNGMYAFAQHTFQINNDTLTVSTCLSNRFGNVPIAEVWLKLRIVGTLELTWETIAHKYDDNGLIVQLVTDSEKFEGVAKVSGTANINIETMILVNSNWFNSSSIPNFNMSYIPVQTTTSAPVEETTTPGPAEETTTTSAPVEETTTPTPVEETTTTSAPVDETTTTAAPVAETTTPAPVDETTTTSAPVEETTTTSAPVEDTTTTPAPVDETTTTSAPVEETTTTSAPVEDTTTTPAPVDETTTTSAPVEETTTTSAPVEDTTTTPAPVDETTTTSAPVEETTTPMPNATGGNQTTNATVPVVYEPIQSAVIGVDVAVGAGFMSRRGSNDEPAEVIISETPTADIQVSSLFTVRSLIIKLFCNIIQVDAPPVRVIIPYVGATISRRLLQTTDLSAVYYSINSGFPIEMNSAEYDMEDSRAVVRVGYTLLFLSSGQVQLMILDRNVIPVATTTPTATPTADSSTLPIIVGAAVGGVILLSCTVGIILYFNRRSSKASSNGQMKSHLRGPDDMFRNVRIDVKRR